jgi:hypothetical protein
MPRRPRQSRRTARTHVDRYAPEAARSQAARQAFDADWERKHPAAAAQPSTDEPAEQEGEEASA